MGDKLTPEELAEFREIFNLVDKDGGGTISKEELGELMETLGIDATPEEIDLMIAEIDEDNSGHIDKQEFARLAQKGKDLLQLNPPFDLEADWEHITREDRYHMRANIQQICR